MPFSLESGIWGRENNLYVSESTVAGFSVNRSMMDSEGVPALGRDPARGGIVVVEREAYFFCSVWRKEPRGNFLDCRACWEYLLVGIRRRSESLSRLLD